MGGLNLVDLGVEPGTEPGPHQRPRFARPDPGAVTIGEAARTSTGRGLQAIVADLGVEQATRCLRRAIQQIWGNRPDLMPAHAVLMSIDITGQANHESLRTLLGVVFAERTANRVITLTRRHADAFLTEHAAWQPRLADEGVTYAEMERRALLGEFDRSGPLPSRFDLATLSYLA